MSQFIEINPGELKINFTQANAGKISFQELGLKDEDLFLDGGFLRLVFDLEQIGEHSYYHIPTIEVSYKENVAATHWQCEFNGTTILDKIDHHGNSTVLLLQRKKIESLEQHHENKLIIHAEFPQSVHLLAGDSYINLFK